MQPDRPRSRWRAGVRLGAYLGAFVLLLGAMLLAVGVVAYLVLGAVLGAWALFGGAITALLIGLGILWMILRHDGEPRVAR